MTLALLASLLLPVLAWADGTAPVSGVLTNAQQIRELTAAQAARRLPVHLQGVVVDESQPRERAVILADTSASLYLSAATNIFAPYHQRDVLDIEGVTSEGEFAPCVVATQAQKIGYAPLPSARPVFYHQIITGALDAQFVEISGVVRECWPAKDDEDVWQIELAADGGILPVRIPRPQDPRVQVDAEVRVRAVCLYQFNARRQVLSPVLQMPRGVTVEIDKLQSPDPYAVPLRSAASLLQFSPNVSYGHRVHVRGVVTCAQPGSLVWIRDDSSGLRIQSSQPDILVPGDVIDVLGFPSHGASTPLLENAIYKKIKGAAPPLPLPLEQPAAAYNYEDDLVTIGAGLTEVQPTLAGAILTLENSGTVFKAILKQAPNISIRSEWQPGSLVRVTGICTVVYDDSRPVMGVWHPQSFQFLLRSPADLIIEKAPPWWTARHIIFLLGIAAGVSLSIAGAILLIARRRLNEQTRRRAMAEAEFGAILSERNRVAREIHDTLAQGLTATSVQLQLAQIHGAGAPEEMYRHVAAAQQLVSGSLEEARNSIWNMRSQVLENGSLASALGSMLTQMADGRRLQTQVTVAGRERRLAPVIENNLLRVGQEAITNATKHAAANNIKVTLDFGEDRFKLVIIDDGCGFDAAQPRTGKGGFGLVGMQERATELKAELNVCTTPGHGTKIILNVPLSGE